MSADDDIAIANQLAPFFPGWRVEDTPDYYAGLIRDSDGARIRIEVDGWRNQGRIVFRGIWPRYADGNTCVGKKQEVTVSKKRSIEAIAKDVRSRFLPGYDHAYAYALEEIRVHEASKAEAELAATRIAALLGASVVDKKIRWRRDGVPITGPLPEAVGRVVVNPDSGCYPLRVNFEVHGLDPDTAAAVLQLIKEAEERAPRTVRVEDAPEDEEDTLQNVHSLDMRVIAKIG